MGLGKHAYPAGTFTCANCVGLAAKITSHCNTEQLTDAAHRLVWLKGMRVQESSQHTYASGLHRYVMFGQKVLGKSAAQMLPPKEGQGIDQCTLELFISWASTKYRYNTISSTMSALVDWHKSKGVAYPAITSKSTKDLLATVKTKQGPAGLPQGKQGLTKPMLRLLLCHLHNQCKSQPDMREIYLRDECAVLLGYYGMMRRSEIAALKLSDIRMGRHAGATFLEVYIAGSKTDKGRVGATVTLVGRTKDGIDIAGPIREYTLLRCAAASGDAPLFSAWDLDARTCRATDGLSTQALAKRLRKHLTDLKRKYPDINVNPESYGMHSLRRGGVMAAWEAGVDVEKIKAHGRWKSDAVRAYMQATRTIKMVVTGRM